MKWEITRDMQFFHSRKDKKFIYLTVKQGSVYNEVSVSDYERDMYRLVKSEREKAKHNERFVVLFVEGKQRIFKIGKDAIPYNSRRIKRKMRVIK
jgi:hypothetical protein